MTEILRSVKSLIAEQFPQQSPNYSLQEFVRSPGTSFKSVKAIFASIREKMHAANYYDFEADFSKSERNSQKFGLLKITKIM